MFYLNTELRIKPEFLNNFKNASVSDIFVIVFVEYNMKRAAVVNMSETLGIDMNNNTILDNGMKGKAYQITKPKIYSFDEVTKIFNFVELEGGVKRFIPPKILRDPTGVLSLKKQKKWFKKRDDAIDKLGFLIEEENIRRYLFQYNATELFEKRLAELREEDPTKKHTSPTALIRYLNQYISLGCTKNALLPIGLVNSGCNYLHNTEDLIIKRGRGGADGRNTSSQHKAITDKDKRIIKKIVKLFGTNKRNGQLLLVEVYYEYCLYSLQQTGYSLPTADSNGKRDLSNFEKHIISYNQFIFHYKNTIPLFERLLLRYGKIKTSRDMLDRQGISTDGVLGANHVVEIDSTELSHHVRDTRVGHKRLSAGRLFICIAVCIKTRYILGYSLSHQAPVWENVAECLFNILDDKKSYCAKYGIALQDYQWESHHDINSVRIDNGIEYPTEEVDELLIGRYGPTRVETVTKARGDLKGIVERLIGTFDREIATLEGGIEAERDHTEQDASQRALFTIDQIHQKIIREIIHHNIYKDCANLLDADMSKAGVGITPRSIWNYSIKEQMSGGQPIAKEQLPFFRYQLLPKLRVVVKDDGLHCKGLIFVGPYAKSENWYLRAKYGEKLEFKMAFTPTSCDLIFFEDNKSNIHIFQLSEKSEQFKGLSWVEVKEARDYLLEQANDLRKQRLASKLINKTEDKAMLADAFESAKNAPKNDQSSYQAGTNSRRKEFADSQAISRDKEIQGELLSQAVNINNGDLTSKEESPLSEDKFL